DYLVSRGRCLTDAELDESLTPDRDRSWAIVLAWRSAAEQICPVGKTLASTQETIQQSKSGGIVARQNELAGRPTSAFDRQLCNHLQLLHRRSIRIPTPRHILRLCSKPKPSPPVIAWLNDRSRAP